MADPIQGDPFIQAALGRTAAAVDATPTTPEKLPDKIPIITSDGELKQVSPDEAIDIQMAGGHVPTAQEEGYKKLVDEQKAVIEQSGGIQGGIGSAALGALSNVPFAMDALKALSPLGADTVRARAQALEELHPYANITGQLAPWFIGGGEAGAGVEAGRTLFGIGKKAVTDTAAHSLLAAPGAGLGAVAEAGAQRVLGNGLVGRAGGFVARNTTEGALYGAIAGENEDAIKDPDHVAESLTHGGVAGAVFQNILGVPLGLTAKALGHFSGPTVSPDLLNRMAGAEEANLAREQMLADAGVPVDQKTGLRGLYNDVHAPFEPEGAVGKVANVHKAINERFNGPGATSDIEETLGPDQVASQNRQLFKDQERIHDSFKERTSPLFDELNAAGPEVQQQVHGDNRLAIFEREMKDMDPTPIAKARDEIHNQMDLLAQDLTGRDAKGFRVADGALTAEGKAVGERLWQTVEQENRQHIGQNLTAAEELMSLERLKRGVRSALTDAGKMVANPNAQFELEQVVPKLVTLHDVALNVSKDPGIVGKDVSDAISKLNTKESKYITAESELRKTGGMGRKPQEGVNWWEHQRAWHLDKEWVANLLKGDDPYATEKLQAVANYVDALQDLSREAGKWYGTDAKAVRLEKLGNALGELVGQAKRSAHATAAVRRMMAGGGQNITETYARGAAALGGTLIGTAFGMPAIGGTLGFFAAPTLGMTGNAAKLISGLNQIENVARKSQNKFQSAVREAVTGHKTTTGQRMAAKDIDALSKKLSGLKEDPTRVQNALAHTIAHLGGTFPKITAALGGRIQAMVEHLSNNLPPARMPGNVLQPHFDTRRQPSTLSQRQMVRRLEAAFLPENVVRNPSKEGVDTFKTLYPTDFSKMQDMLLDAVAGHNKPLTFDIRQKLGLLLELPTDTLQDPRRWAEFQNIMQPGDQSKPQAPKRPLKSAQQLISMSDSLEMGGANVR